MEISDIRRQSNIVADLASHQGVVKGYKKAV